MADPNRALSAIETAEVRSVAGQAVIDGRAEIIDEIAGTESEVRQYIASEIGASLKDEDFVEALSGFLLPDAASQARRTLLEQRLSAIAAL